MIESLIKINVLVKYLDSFLIRGSVLSAHHSPLELMIPPNSNPQVLAIAGGSFKPESCRLKHSVYSTLMVNLDIRRHAILCCLPDNSAA